MVYIKYGIALFGMTCLVGCMQVGPNPDDPYEKINRKIYAFNVNIDKYILKPPAEAYAKIVPSKIRAGVNNVYNNLNMMPTIANDILQADLQSTIKDSWRFIANTTIGIGGIFNPASTFGLPPHSNDLGLTFAKWGDKKSPYIMLPFLGPTTIRDGVGLMFDYTFFTIYPYLHSDPLIYSILALRYIDLRAQMLDTDKLINLSMDKYAFIRDAYLQHRNYLINGEQKTSEDLYIDEEENNTNPILKQSPANGIPSKFPLTTA